MIENFVIIGIFMDLCLIVKVKEEMIHRLAVSKMHVTKIIKIQKNLNDSNIDGSFTLTNTNSFSSP